jgi:hypothetical protein
MWPTIARRKRVVDAEDGQILRLRGLVLGQVWHECCFVQLCGLSAWLQVRFHEATDEAMAEGAPQESLQVCPFRRCAVCECVGPCVLRKFGASVTQRCLSGRGIP